MKITPATFRSLRRQRAWALLAVMTLSAAGLMVLAGVMSWADENSAVTARNNEYFTTSYAAEAATEKVLAKMSADFQNGGVANDLGFYASIIPIAVNDGPYWQNYAFSGGHTANSVIVTNTWSGSTNLGAPYTGLQISENTYEIIANAQNTSSMYQIVSTVGQQINLGLIPLFQFAIFYQDLMELEPQAPMTVTGEVHGNADILVAPENGLTFASDVSASGQLNFTNSASDPILFQSGPGLSGVDPLNLPVGVTNNGTATNVSQNVYGILQLPQPGQTPNTVAGQNLLYNKADLVIVISPTGDVSVSSGPQIPQNVTLTSNDWAAFMNLGTNGSFLDQRDGLTVNPVTIDVSNLVQWSATNQTLRPSLANYRSPSQADIQSIYVDDQRNTTNTVDSTSYTFETNYTTNSFYTTNVFGPALGAYEAGTLSNMTNSSGRTVAYIYVGVNTVVTSNAVPISSTEATTQPGIVLSNGAVLPPQGLAVATPDPAYIVGNWNVQNSTNANAPNNIGQNQTTYALPSAIYADAITILSPAWNPASSTLAVQNRNAVSDTVNSAFLTGNVPSANGEYSGGVENLARLLEDWTGQTLTYNGSMVCMFPSQIATAPYLQPGTTNTFGNNVFTPPTRNWAFDTNFYTASKQPPLTPKVITVQRNQWVLLPPYATSF